MRIIFDLDNVNDIIIKIGYEYFVKNKMVVNLVMKFVISKIGKNVNLFNECNFLLEIIDEKYEMFEIN